MPSQYALFLLLSLLFSLDVMTSWFSPSACSFSQRKAREQGITISPAYISEIRKAFFGEQTA